MLSALLVEEDDKREHERRRTRKVSGQTERPPKAVKEPRFHAVKCTILSARGGAEMAKCNLTDCEAKAVGGFKELIDASSHQFPNATIEGQQTAWCADHEDILRRTIRGKRGKPLTAKQLK